MLYFIYVQYAIVPQRSLNIIIYLHIIPVNYKRWTNVVEVWYVVLETFPLITCLITDNLCNKPNPEEILVLIWTSARFPVCYSNNFCSNLQIQNTGLFLFLKPISPDKITSISLTCPSIIFSSRHEHLLCCPGDCVWRKMGWKCLKASKQAFCSAFKGSKTANILFSVEILWAYFQISSHFRSQNISTNDATIVDFFSFLLPLKTLITEIYLRYFLKLF